MVRMKRKAQNLSEYAIMLGVVIGAVLLSQDMVKKALVNKFKDGSDALNNTKGSIAGEVAFGGSHDFTAYDEKADSTSDYSKNDSINKGFETGTSSESSFKEDRTKKKNY